MNQLETLELLTGTVTFGNTSLTVRGLGFADITYIIRHHRAITSDLYAKAIAGKLSGDVSEIAVNLLDDFAPLAGMVIALAMGKPTSAAVEKASSLPLTVQCNLIEKIVELTLVGEGGLEKLMEIIVRVVSATAKQTSPEA